MDHSHHSAGGGAHDHHNMGDAHAGHDLGLQLVEAVARAGKQLDPGHDHDTAGHGGHGMSMSMVFHGGCNETVLFDFWKFTTVGGLIGSIIVIFTMAVLYEGLKYYREYLFWKTYNNLQYKAVQGNGGNKDATVEDDARVVHMMGEVYRKEPPSMLSKVHSWQTFLHAVQVTVSYLLMLIFMTYNTWLCIAVVLGAATGNFLFGWRKHVIVDVTEHCH